MEHQIREAVNIGEITKQTSVCLNLKSESEGSKLPGIMYQGLREHQEKAGALASG